MKHWAYDSMAYLSIGANKNQFGEKLRYMGTTECLAKIISRCHIEQVVIAMETEDHENVGKIPFSIRRH